MDWFYNSAISLLGESEGVMYHGTYQAGEPVENKSIPCDVQPSGREEFYKEYGYYIDCNYAVYCDADTAIVEGNKVRYKGNDYTINKLVTWDDYYILYIGAVVNE